MVDERYVSVDVDRIKGMRIPLPSSIHLKPTIATTDKHHVIELPHALKSHIHIRHTNASTLKALFKKIYHSSTHTYAIQYSIPIVHLSNTDIGERYRNYMHLHLCMTGTHERYQLHSCCRVQQISATVVVFPVFLSQKRQREHLLKLPPVHHLQEHLIAHQLHFIELHSIESVNNVYQQSVAPETKATQGYVETSEKSRRLKKMQQQATMDSHLHTYDRLPKDTGREPGCTIGKLSYFGGPDVLVKELDKTMTVLAEERTPKKTPLSSPPASIRHQLQRHGLEKYINSRKTLAVVAVLPQMHLSQSMHIVAAVLFQYVEPVLVAHRQRTSQRKTHPAHIQLKHVLVDPRYDEYVQDSKQQRDTYGIRQTLIRLAIPYTQKIFGPHDIYYTHQHRSTHKALLQSGHFRKQKPARHSGIATRVKHTLHAQIHMPVLKYTAKSDLKCTGWEECKQMVQQKYPNMSLKDVLILTSELCPTSRKKHTHNETPKRSRRLVSAKQGAAILQTYYTQKHLAPAGISLSMSKKEVEKALDSKASQHAVDTYCKAVRQHLQRTRKHTLLRQQKKNTWKYRPDPTVDITSDTRIGPDKYILEELDASCEPGISLMKKPMGKCTPHQYVADTNTNNTSINTNTKATGSS